MEWFEQYADCYGLKSRVDFILLYNVLCSTIVVHRNRRILSPRCFQILISLCTSSQTNDMRRSIDGIQYITVVSHNLELSCT